MATNRLPEPLANATLTSKTLVNPTVQNPSVTSGTFIAGTFTSSPTLGTPTIHNPSVTSGTFVTPVLQSPSTTGGTSIGETIQNPSVTSGTFVTPTLQNPSVTSGTFIGGTFTSAPTLNRPTFAGTATIAQMLETAAVTSGAVATTLTYNVLDQGAVTYHTGNASANWTTNVRGSSTTSLVNYMTTGQSLTIAYLVTNGGTAYYQTGFQIDGTSVTPKWQNAAAPSSGNANSIDIYSMTIVRVSSTSTVASAFTAFGTQTKFA